MKYFIPFYGEFHTDIEFHKKIADTAYKVIQVLEPDALDNFSTCNSGLGYEDNLTNAMSIVYNLLEAEIKEFYQYDISLESFLGKVVLYDDFAE